MTGLVFAPLVPLWALVALGAVALLAVALAAWRGLRGGGLRALAAAVLLAALAGPALEHRGQATQDDIFIVLYDESGSNRLAGRTHQSSQALADLRRDLAGRGRVEVVSIADGADDSGTLAMEALNRALSEAPLGQIAGIFAISDGQVHDAERAPPLPAPLHLLRTGEREDWDRRIALTTAPAYGILGEDVTIGLRVEDMGAAPGDSEVDLEISVDGGAALSFRVPVGEDMSLPFRLPHAGDNIVRLQTPAAPGELTEANNSAVVRINGIRDRLRVMLISGEPHAGERTWRNLLKSDPAVDLVHFTILRPPGKSENVPQDEMSLIAFPTRELFLEKIDEFDLIVFDRYRLRGILPATYLDNIRSYVEDGGAVLVAAGPSYAGAESIYRSALGDILPGAPTARVVEQAFRPEITETGARHPVTRGLSDWGEWGRWLRLIDVTPTSGEVLMQGPQGRPLLIADRVGDGRVMLLASDHAWLWDRGFEGGGPQLELLRRVAHWAMQEPDLEEERLTALPDQGGLTVRLQTLDPPPEAAQVVTPEGERRTVPLREVAPGLYEGRLDETAQGLTRLSAGDLETVIATGPASTRELEATIASDAPLAPLIATRAGGAFAIDDGLPRLREVREGRPAAGRGWAGITPRESAVITDLTRAPLLPAWAWLLIAASLMLWGWLREGR